jgi:uncharacterized membrane protein
MKILFLTDHANNSSYLKRIFDFQRYDFQQVSAKDTLKNLDERYDLYIFNGYPHENLSLSSLDFIKKSVEEGSGLLMTGGKSSFTGKDGFYQGSLLEEILPVTLRKKDDRICCYQGVFLRKETDHPIIQRLNLAKPPIICGYNDFSPKTGSLVVLSGSKVVYNGSNYITRAESIPLLVTGSYGRGNVAALAMDLNSHWSGGLIDWGLERVELSFDVEMGDHYFQFITQLIDWFKNSKY